MGWMRLTLFIFVLFAVRNTVIWHTSNLLPLRGDFSLIWNGLTKRALVLYPLLIATRDEYSEITSSTGRTACLRIWGIFLHCPLVSFRRSKVHYITLQLSIRESSYCPPIDLDKIKSCTVFLNAGNSCRFSIIDSASWVSFCSKNKQKDLPIWCKFKKWKIRKGRQKHSTLKLYLIIWRHGGVYSFSPILYLCTCLHLHLFVKCSLSGKGLVSWSVTSCWALSNFHCCLSISWSL